MILNFMAPAGLHLWFFHQKNSEDGVPRFFFCKIHAKNCIAMLSNIKYFSGRLG